MLGISGLKFIFISHQKFIVYGQKKHLKRIGCNKNAHAAAIKTLMQKVPYANTAIARDLVSAFGPLLYGPLTVDAVGGKLKGTWPPHIDS